MKIFEVSNEFGPDNVDRDEEELQHDQDELGIDEYELSRDEEDLEDDVLDDEFGDENADPDRQGLIRSIPGARLVYKREENDGTYAEMWIYSTSELRKAMEVRKAILSGTDIPAGARKSTDQLQSYETWASGNIEVLVIYGLPN